MSNLFGLMREHPIGTLIFGLAVLLAAERIVSTLINRNKPIKCDCDPEHDTLPEDEDEDEITSFGGEEEDSR